MFTWSFNPLAAALVTAFSKFPTNKIDTRIRDILYLNLLLQIHLEFYSRNFQFHSEIWTRYSQPKNWTQFNSLRNESESKLCEYSERPSVTEHSEPCVKSSFILVIVSCQKARMQLTAGGNIVIVATTSNSLFDINQSRCFRDSLLKSFLETVFSRNNGKRVKREMMFS